MRITREAVVSRGVKSVRVEEYKETDKDEVLGGLIKDDKWKIT